MKKTHVYFLILIMLAGFMVNAHNVKAFTKGDGHNSLPVELAIPGDIILTKGSIFDLLVPGYWTHAEVYIGWAYRYDEARGYWHWDYYVVHSTSEGVHYSTWADAVWGADEAALIRVKISDYIRSLAVSFAESKVGYPYDYWWLSKQVLGSSYYCSELAWAAYKYYGVDIDANPGWSWTYAYGVAPQELYDDGDTYLVAYSD
ncbi:MAG: YiiX/YebB-like N1pC/P60 family cysteine hydrolase [Candidatus Njordarchaeia archaeon]